MQQEVTGQRVFRHIRTLKADSIFKYQSFHSLMNKTIAWLSLSAKSRETTARMLTSEASCPLSSDVSQVRFREGKR